MLLPMLFFHFFERKKAQQSKVEACNEVADKLAQIDLDQGTEFDRFDIKHF